MVMSLYASKLHNLKYLNRADFQQNTPEYDAKPLTIMCDDPNTENECWATGDELDVPFADESVGGGFGHFEGVCQRECGTRFMDL